MIQFKHMPVSGFGLIIIDYMGMFNQLIMPNEPHMVCYILHQRVQRLAAQIVTCGKQSNWSERMLLLHSVSPYPYILQVSGGGWSYK